MTSNFDFNLYRPSFKTNSEVLKMTVQDLKKWLRSREEEDVWWIQIAGETLGRKVNLGRIEQILDENLDSEVIVLHVSQATQRPRPWVEVERVKAAPVEKPHDVGLGRQTKGAHSGEREPGPVRKIDVVRSPASQSSESAPEEHQHSNDLPPLPNRHSITGRLDPTDNKVSVKCNECGRVAKYSSKKFPFRVRCRSCQFTHLIEKVEISSWQFYKAFFGHLLLLSLPALVSATIYNRSAEAKTRGEVANMFGKDINLFPSYFFGQLIGCTGVYLISTFLLSLIFFNRDLKYYNLSRFDGFKSRMIRYGGWGCGIAFVLVTLACLMRVFAASLISSI